MHASSEAILELSLAWYLTGNTAYADQAELVARTWYLNAATAMNPSMAHAQSQGPCGNGTATGIIEAAGYLTDALDGLSILELDTRDSGWTTTDRAGMKTWLGKYVTFLKTSSQGKAENAASNNHGSWFDATLSSIYLYLGDTVSAKALVTASQKRMDSQMESDGRMPEELARQTSWHYENYGASAFCRIAGVAKKVGVDIWGYTTPKGATLAKAIAYMIPTAITANPPGPWAQYNDITKPFDPAYQAEAYYSIRAAAEYGNNAQAKAVFAQTPYAVRCRVTTARAIAFRSAPTSARSPRGPLRSVTCRQKASLRSTCGHSCRPAACRSIDRSAARRPAHVRRVRRA